MAYVNFKIWTETAAVKATSVMGLLPQPCFHNNGRLVLVCFGLTFEPHNQWQPVTTRSRLRRLILDMCTLINCLMQAVSISFVELLSYFPSLMCVCVCACLHILYLVKASKKVLSIRIHVQYVFIHGHYWWSAPESAWPVTWPITIWDSSPLGAPPKMHPFVSCVHRISQLLSEVIYKLK